MTEDNQKGRGKRQAGRGNRKEREDKMKKKEGEGSRKRHEDGQEPLPKDPDRETNRIWRENEEGKAVGE